METAPLQQVTDAIQAVNNNTAQPPPTVSSTTVQVIHTAARGKSKTEWIINHASSMKQAVLKLWQSLVQWSHGKGKQMWVSLMWLKNVVTLREWRFLLAQRFLFWRLTQQMCLWADLTWNRGICESKPKTGTLHYESLLIEWLYKIRETIGAVQIKFKVLDGQNSAYTEKLTKELSAIKDNIRRNKWRLSETNMLAIFSIYKRLSLLIDKKTIVDGDLFTDLQKTAEVVDAWRQQLGNL
jgi:hypothetical protein